MVSELKIGDVISLEEVENVVADKIIYKKNSYILFSDVQDNTKISIRKEVKGKNGLEIVSLDNEKEFKKVVALFIKKNSEE